MSWEQIIGLLLALLVMGVGALGCLIPGLPGTPLVLAAAVGHKLWFGDTGVHWWVMVLLVLLTALALVLDYLATVVGARKMGATRRGSIGAMLGTLGGAFVGFFFGGIGSLVGILIGPLVCAMLFERTASRPWGEAFRAGVGATLGILAGALGKTGICLVMILIFAVDVVLRSWK